MATPYRRTFARLLGFLRPYRWSLSVSCVLAAGSQVAQILIAVVTGRIVNTAIEPHDERMLWILVLTIVALGLVKALMMVGRRLISGNQALGVEFDIRNAMYAKLVRLSFGFYDRHQTGQLMSRATVDLQQVRFFLGYGLIFFFQHILTVVGVTAAMFFYNWRLALIAVAMTPILVGLAYRYSHISHPLLRDVQQKMADVATVAEENIVGVHVVKSFAQEQQEQAKFEQRSELVFGRSVDANRQRALYVPLISFVPLLGQAAVLLVGGAMVINGHLSLGAFITFNLFMGMLVTPLRSLGMWIGQAQRATASGERIFEVLDEPEEIADAPGGRDLPPGKGRVRFERVSFGYAAGRHVLEEIDLEVEPGRTIALIGHTGSGKTTLTSLVPRFYDPTEGRVTIDGVDVRDVTLASLRRSIGVISQDPFLFSASVRDNIAFGTADASDGGRRACGASGTGARIRRTASGRLRHHHRRARDHALGRPAPTARDRARARDRPADPDPRRRDRLRRRDDRGTDPAGPTRGDARPDDAHHRPSSLDHRARGRGRRAGSRPHRRARSPRRAHPHEPRLSRDLRARAARSAVHREPRGDGVSHRRGGFRLRVRGTNGHGLVTKETMRPGRDGIRLTPSRGAGRDPGYLARASNSAGRSARQ